jgi:hypothetical protein
VLAVVLALATWTGLPGITSLLVVNGAEPSPTPAPTDVAPSAEDRRTCSTRATTSTGKITRASLDLSGSLGVR